MKRLGFLLAVFALGAAALTSASAQTDATKTTICHRTKSSEKAYATTKPYVKLKVSAKALRAHLKHAADIIPAPRGGCPSTVLSATSGGRAFPVALTGEVEVPAGDPVATGTATIRLRAGQGQLCYQLAAKNLPAAAAAHIHRGGTGSAGPVVVPLQTPNAAGESSGCANASRTLVKGILADAESYYVNVHTSEFPAGAIRGQLTGTSTAAFGTIETLDLKGTTEPNASGTAVLRIRKDAELVCYRLHAANVTLPTVAAHIHRGASGTNGPVVLPFTAPAADGNSSGCGTATTQLIDEILANPPGFYVNVHTKEHPGGAIRAQLG
jgi:CHRD domain-containing protein